MKTFENIGNWFSSIIGKNIDWISSFFLIPLAYQSYAYFFEYDDIFVPYALHFQTYSDFNWVSFILLLGYCSKMGFIGRVVLIGIFNILIANTIHLHIGFTDSVYFVIYIGFAYIFVLAGYLIKIFGLIEQYFTLNRKL